VDIFPQSGGSYPAYNVQSDLSTRDDLQRNTKSAENDSGKNSRIRRTSSSGGGGGKIGFIGMMQQLVFDGRELSEQDNDDSPGSSNRKHRGHVKSTAGIDAAGGPATFTSSDAYIVLRSTKKDKHHSQQQQQQQPQHTTSMFSVYFQVNCVHECLC